MISLRLHYVHVMLDVTRRATARSCAVGSEQQRHLFRWLKLNDLVHSTGAIYAVTRMKPNISSTGYANTKGISVERQIKGLRLCHVSAHRYQPATVGGGCPPLRTHTRLYCKLPERPVSDPYQVQQMAHKSIDFIQYWIKTKIYLSMSRDCHGDDRYYHHSVIMRNIDNLNLRPDDVMLDVGCSTGEETKALASKVGSATGIDSSEEMVAFARANNLAPNVSYSLGDAQTIGNHPEWQERFDKAVSFFVLHWCPDHAEALRNILACLKPGGEALLIVINRTTLISEVHRFLNSHVKWGHYVTGFENTYSFWDRSVAETEELLATCGWTNLRCEIQHHLPSTEFQTKLFMKTSLGISSLIPESEQEAYFEDIWQWALSRYEVETQAGYVFLPIDLMVMQASKPL